MEGEKAAGMATDFEFVGVKKCKLCHRAEKSGAQYKVWEDSQHAKAYETLGTEAAKKVAAEQDIDDPQSAPACLKCHVTAFPVMDDLENARITLEEGVSCETCHGAGSEYWKKKTMEQVFSGEIEASSVGLITPDKETCVRCHNDESPTFKGFEFEEAWAQIAHPYPEGYRDQ